jgi:hypothetical protein
MAVRRPSRGKPIARGDYFPDEQRRCRIVVGSTVLGQSNDRRLICRLKDMMAGLPVDGKRMIFGGFETFLQM